MSTSSKLTRMMIVEWIKDHLATIFFAPLVTVAAVVLSLNVPISRTAETAKVIRNQLMPDDTKSTALLTFVELPNGRTTFVTIPQGFAPPAPGSRINVMHGQRLLFGDSFEWIQ